MKVYYDPATEGTPEVIAGNPPVDQSAYVAQLEGELAQFKAFRDAVVADANARKAADAAKTEGQDVLDAAAGLPV